MTAQGPPPGRDLAFSLNVFGLFAVRFAAAGGLEVVMFIVYLYH